jgi:hypothetical protein
MSKRITLRGPIACRDFKYCNGLNEFPLKVKKKNILSWKDSSLFYDAAIK